MTLVTVKLNSFKLLLLLLLLLQLIHRFIRGAVVGGISSS